jgi:adenine phosphoribosyltransferase
VKTPAAAHVNTLLAWYPDVPQDGILFRDLNPVFADAAAFRSLIDELVGRFEGQFDAVAGIEARGFLLAAAVGYAADVAVLAVRKGGKLPGSVLSEEYDLEYGSACLELEIGQLAPRRRGRARDRRPLTPACRRSAIGARKRSAVGDSRAASTTA